MLGKNQIRLREELILNLSGDAVDEKYANVVNAFATAVTIVIANNNKEIEKQLREMRVLLP